MEGDVKFGQAVTAQVQYSVLAVEAFSSISLDRSKEAAVQLAVDCNCCAHSRKIMWCPHAKVRADVTCHPDSIVVMVARWSFDNEKNNDSWASAWSMMGDVAACMPKDMELKVRGFPCLVLADGRYSHTAHL